MEKEKYIIIEYYTAKLKLRVNGFESEKEIRDKIFKEYNIHPKFQYFSNSHFFIKAQSRMELYYL